VWVGVGAGAEVGAASGAGAEVGAATGAGAEVGAATAAGAEVGGAGPGASACCARRPDGAADVATVRLTVGEAVARLAAFGFFVTVAVAVTVTVTVTVGVGDCGRVGCAVVAWLPAECAGVEW